MKSIQFILGGCRSGKSKYALDYANQNWHSKKFFIATCEALDNEMKSRITNHQKERGPNWKTVECPIDIASVIEELAIQKGGILLDCVTLWINNLMCNSMDDNQIKEKVETFVNTLQKISCPITVVSNEVGMGIVPENAMARQYRDLVGYTNQKIAAISNNVILMVAGIPFQIKSE